MNRDRETPRPEICGDATTMIKYLLPGCTTTNTGVLGSETLRSTTILLATVLITFSWFVTAVLTIALRSAGGSRSRWADSLFMGERDDFSWDMKPDRAQSCQTTRVEDHRNRRTSHGGIRRPLELKCSNSIATRTGS